MSHSEWRYGKEKAASFRRERERERRWSWVRLWVCSDHGVGFRYYWSLSYYVGRSDDRYILKLQSCHYFLFGACGMYEPWANNKQPWSPEATYMIVSERKKLIRRTTALKILPVQEERAEMKTQKVALHWKRHRIREKNKGVMKNKMLIHNEEKRDRRKRNQKLE